MASKWKTGVFKGKAVIGSAKYGKSTGGHDQIGLVLRVAQGGGQSREGSTYIVFTEDTQDWAIERLRALGWKGTDIRDLQGIGTNYVDVDVSYRETTDDGSGETKETLQLDIIVPARVIMKQEMTTKQKDDFAKRVADAAAKIPEVAYVPIEKPNNTPRSAADLPPNHPDHPDNGP